MLNKKGYITVCVLVCKEQQSPVTSISDWESFANRGKGKRVRRSMWLAEPVQKSSAFLHMDILWNKFHLFIYIYLFSADSNTQKIHTELTA